MKNPTARVRAAARFEAAVESSPAGMIMVNNAGAIVLCNHAVERLFGYSRDELLGKSVELLVPGAARARHPEFRANFQAHPSARHMGVGRELFGVRKDGTQVPVEIGLNPIEMDAGLFVLASVVDITERRRAAAERDELIRRLVDLQNRERRDLAHELHDEMGQMLTALKLMLETQGLGGVEDMKAMVGSLAEAGIPEALPDILDKYRRDAPVRLAALVAAAVAADATALQRAAHAFKSSAGAIHAGTLAALLQETESAARAGDVPAAVARLGRIQNECRAVEECLQAAL